MNETARRMLYVLFVAVAAYGGYDFSQTSHNSELTVVNRSTISGNAERIAAMEQSIFALERSVYADQRQKGAFCHCVARSNETQPKLQACKAKNATCDSESQEICESIFPNYDC